MKNKLKINQVNIIGKIVNTRGLDEIKRANKDGSEFVSGSVTIDIGKGQLLEVDVYSKKFTKEGQPSKLFERYLELSKEVGTMVKCTSSNNTSNAEFTENRFWGRNDQIASVNKISGRFFNVAVEGDQPKADFKFGGYVFKPVYERLDREGNLLHYETVIAQPNWNGTKPLYVKFAIDKNNSAVINGMEAQYVKGATVEVKGNIELEIETRVVDKAGDVAFGDASTEEYKNTYVKYVITGGNKPLDIDAEGAYRPDEIAMLTKSYDEEGLLIEDAARKKADTNQTSFSNKETAKSSRTKLI
jgi:hypothetical protein